MFGPATHRASRAPEPTAPCILTETNRGRTSCSREAERARKAAVNLARHADGRIVCADSSIGWGNGVRRRKNGKNGGRVKLLGSRSSPSRCVLCFIMISGLLFCLSTRPLSQSLQGYLPGWEFNSKRIALVADAAMIVERSNQSVRCLEAVLFFFRLAAGRVPTATPPKESVSCASAILFLLCWSRYVLFLLSSSLLVIVVVPIHKQMPCQFSKPSKIKGLRFSVGRRRAQKPGSRYR